MKRNSETANVRVFSVSIHSPLSQMPTTTTKLLLSENPLIEFCWEVCKGSNIFEASRKYSRWDFLRYAPLPSHCLCACKHTDLTREAVYSAVVIVAFRSVQVTAAPEWLGWAICDCAVYRLRIQKHNQNTQMHIYIYIYINTYTHTYLHKNTRTNKHIPYTHTYIHTYIHNI